MRTYQCHKRVKAAQITDILQASDGTTVYRLDGGNFSIPHPGTTTYQPVVGDYIVDYEDGYRSISPKAPFEAGYAELPSEEELAQAVAFTVQPHVGASAEVKPIVEHGAIVGVQVVKDGCTDQELTFEPLTDELACLMFGCKAGMAIAERMGGR